MRSLQVFAEGVTEGAEEGDGSKEQKVTGGCIKVHNERFHILVRR